MGFTPFETKHPFAFLIFKILLSEILCFEGMWLKKLIIQCVPEKTEPWNNGMLRASCGVYDYYHIYFMNYD